MPSRRRLFQQLWAGPRCPHALNGRALQNLPDAELNQNMAEDAMRDTAGSMCPQGCPDAELKQNMAEDAMGDTCPWEAAAVEIRSQSSHSRLLRKAKDMHTLALRPRHVPPRCQHSLWQLLGCFPSPGDSWGPRPPQKFRKSH